MDRHQAIEILVEIQVKNLTPEHRQDQLETMCLEDWSKVPLWEKLPDTIKEEFENNNLKRNPEHECYDQV
jgi:hypothetical protein